jgi:arginine repressor
MRQYVITEAEYQSLLDKLDLAQMRSDNISDPYRSLDDEWRQLTDKEKANMKMAIDSIHRGIHMVVVRWAQEMGFDGRRK